MARAIGSSKASSVSMPRPPRRRITKPKHDLWQTHFDRPNQAGWRDVTLHGGSYAAHGDRPGLTIATRRTTTPSGHVNQLSKTPEAQGASGVHRLFLFAPAPRCIFSPALTGDCRRLFNEINIRI